MRHTTREEPRSALFGPYSKLTNPHAPNTDYDDTNLQGGQTRYYVATSVNASNEESSYSKEVAIQIP